MLKFQNVEQLDGIVNKELFNKIRDEICTLPDGNATLICIK